MNECKRVFPPEVHVQVVINNWLLLIATVASSSQPEAPEAFPVTCIKRESCYRVSPKQQRIEIILTGTQLTAHTQDSSLVSTAADITSLERITDHIHHQ